MSTIDWAKLGQMASEAGYSTTELPVGFYTGTVVTGKFTPAAGKKKAQFGFRFKVSGGPHDGESVWMNQSVPDGSEKNAGGAAAVFIRIMGDLGIDGSQDEAVAAKAVEGKSFDFEVSHRPKVPGPGNWVDVKLLTAAVPSAPAAAPAAAAAPAPAPAAAAAEVAQPTAEQVAAFLAAQQQAAPAADGAAPWSGQRPI